MRERKRGLGLCYECIEDIRERKTETWFDAEPLNAMTWGKALWLKERADCDRRIDEEAEAEVEKEEKKKEEEGGGGGEG